MDTHGNTEGVGLEGVASEEPARETNLNANHLEVMEVNNSVERSDEPVIKGTGRKKFRRKSLFNNRSGGTGSGERPKKRSRENNDLFDVDRLIGIMQVNPVVPSSVETGGEENGGSRSEDSGVFMTPDLNKGGEASRSVDEEVEEVATTCMPYVTVRQQRSLEEESIKTIELSKALGVENLEAFATNVKEVLLSEGYQPGTQ